MRDHTARDDTELTFEVGDILDIAGTDHQEWWEARLDDACGVIPATYVRAIPALERRTSVVVDVSGGGNKPATES